MNLNEYQKQATTTAIYKDEILDGLAYATLGLTGEAGEVANLVKKVYRDEVDKSEEIFDELGDVLWYVAMVAYEMCFNLESIADANLAKLKHRHG